MRTLIRAVVLLGPLVVSANGSAVLAAEAVKTLEIGDQAPDFELPGVDDRQYCLADFADAKLLAVVFTCNHCPTAQAYESRIMQLHADYKDRGVALVAINPNDDQALRLDELGYTDVGDSLSDMQLRAKQRGFKFPYLYDGDTQKTAAAYGVIATPQVFLFDSDRKLRYVGRIDDSDVREVKSHDARNAIEALLAGKPVPVEKTRTFGCSTKWSEKRAEAQAAIEKWNQEPVSVTALDEAALAKLVKNDAENLLLVNVWATWCGPCVKELPEFATINRMYRHRNFKLVTISMDEPDAAEAVLKELRKSYLCAENYHLAIVDRDRFANLLDRDWGGPLPYTLLIAPRGKVVYRKSGEIDPLEVKRAIVDVLGRTYASGGEKSRGDAKPVTYRVVLPRRLWDEDQLSLLDSKPVQVELGLTEEQTRRLEQIRLQAQGANAFVVGELAQRLGLSDDQVAKVRKIAEEVRTAANQAAWVTFPPDKEQPRTVDEVRAFIDSEEFQSAKTKAQQALLEKWNAAIEQVEQALTEPQRIAYRELLGKPFDLMTLLSGGESTDLDVRLVAGSFGLLGQRADADFDVSVARPACSGRHLCVLFDEGHGNFHTVGGRYKAFAGLIVHDGYCVTPTNKPFTVDLLAGCRVLIIANASATREDVARDRGSAFTDTECDAVQQWVQDGGGLLLITDHEPFGSASESLARRFEVDMSKRFTDDPANATGDGLLFSRNKDLIREHPVTNGRDESERVNRVLTFAGQSLKGPPGSVPFLRFADTATEADDGNELSAAGRAQGIALTYGKGRVVVLGEAGQLSAQVFGFPPERFGMNVPGCDNRQMALNIMHWLSGLID